MVRIPTHGPPTHPGEILLEEFLKPLNLQLAWVNIPVGVTSLLPIKLAIALAIIVIYSALNAPFK